MPKPFISLDEAGDLSRATWPEPAQTEAVKYMQPDLSPQQLGSEGLAPGMVEDYLNYHQPVEEYEPELVASPPADAKAEVQKRQAIEKGMARILAKASKIMKPEEFQALLEKLQNRQAVEEGGLTADLEQAEALGERAKEAQAGLNRVNVEMAQAENIAADEIATLRENAVERQALLEGQRDTAILEAESQIRNAELDFARKSSEIGQNNFGFGLARSITMLGNAIGMGMGAAAGILSGQGGNTVAPVAQQTMAMIDKIIADDVKAQRMGLDAARRKVGMKRNALQTVRQHFQDEQQAEDMLKATLLLKTRGELEARLAAAKEPMAVAQGQEMLLQIDERVNELKTHIRDNSVRRSMENIGMQADILKAQQQSRLQKFQIEQSVRGAAAEAPSIKVGPEGKFGEVQLKGTLSPSERMHVRKQIAKSAKVMNIVDRAAEITARGPEDGLDFVDKLFSEGTDREQILNLLLAAEKERQNFGAAFTASELQIVRGIITGNRDLLEKKPWADVKGAVEKYRTAVMDDFASEMEAFEGRWNYDRPKPAYKPSGRPVSIKERYKRATRGAE